MGLFFCVEQKALLVRKEVSDEDPEVRKVVKVNDSNIQNSSVLSRLQQITSSLIKMKRIMALSMIIKGI